jgi:Peptidase M50B-like
MRLPVVLFKSEDILRPKMKQLIILVSILTGIFLLWEYPVLYPLKLLVVFFHESSHALMTVFTGGEVVEMVINQQQGGHVLSRGGNRFLTLSAGYLGSLVWGAIIYLLAAKTKLDRVVMCLLGLTIIGIAVFFMSDLFALGFSLLTAIVMLALAFKAPIAVNDIVLQLIGLTSMCYAPLDIISDTIIRSNLRSDAYMLAEEFGGSTMLWGALWVLVSVVLVVISLKLGFTSNRTPPASTDSYSV